MTIKPEQNIPDDEEILVEEDESSVRKKRSPATDNLLGFGIQAISDVVIQEVKSDQQPGFLEVEKAISKMAEQEQIQYRNSVIENLDKYLKDAYNNCLTCSPENIGSWENNFRDALNDWIEKLLNQKRYLPLELELSFITILGILKNSRFRKPSDIQDFYNKIKRLLN